MAGILVFFCFLLVLTAVLLFKGEIISPAFLLTTAFFVASLNLFQNRDTWLFNSKDTVTLIVLGIFFFILGCLMINLFHSLFNKTNNNLKTSNVSDNNYRSVSQLSLYIYFCMQLILYSFIAVYVCRSMGMAFNLASLSSAIGGYYDATQNGTINGLPSILNVGQIINTSGIYYLLFLLVSKYVNKQNVPVVLYFNIFLGISGSLLTGTKTSFFMYIVGFVVMYFFLKNGNSFEIQKISIRSILELIISIVVVLYGFAVLSNVQGRSIESVSIAQTISTYIGAPIKNLEVFMNTSSVDYQVFGAQTFESTFNWLYKITGNNLFQITNIYHYNWVNNIGLGNVYTIFMPLFNDFGYLGSYFVMFLLGCFSQACYNGAKYKSSNGPINFRIIFYSYLSFAIIFSFFSNKMFEMIFSRSGLYFILGLFIFDIFLRRLTFSKEVLEDIE